ncbi:VQ motif-containing protein 22-like [Telopea speciosissima]|uniref:VQ motif-containing protein 22-like n=1 Tax=Telopea speciosissima TaxID=54955 RepID=UPI001CC41A3A|nr:VQ motif-containing protein 22-like [Telopea speciosissima]
MSDTMASPGDWFQFYRRNPTGEDRSPPPASSAMYGQFSDATVVTSVSTPATGNSTLMSTGSTHLNAEGRVAKPSRRRSRASRRAPTTLLNTDTTNFRAMVQQFTGVPSAPFTTTGSQTGPTTNFNFGLGSGQHNLNTATVMNPSGYHLQQQQFQQQQQQQYMLYMNNNNNNNNNNSTRDEFLERFNNGNQRSNMEVSVSDGFLMDSIFLPRAS